MDHDADAAGPRSHDHEHTGAANVMTASAAHRTRLFAAFAITAVFTVVQAVTALSTGSLALLSDTGHMLTDVLGLGMALLAVEVSRRVSHSPRRSFGAYRLEVLAALANSVLLTGVGVYALFEALRRIGAPPEVPPLPMLIVAVLGLAANLVSFALLRSGAAKSLAVEGAYLEVMADLLGSVAVIMAAGLILLTGWGWVDPIVGAGIGLFVLPRAWRLGRKSLAVLLQTAPVDVDADVVRRDLADLDGVLDVHDLHLWTLTSGLDVASAHLMITADADYHAVLDRARVMLVERHNLDHATLQVEPENHSGCAEMTW